MVVTGISSGVIIIYGNILREIRFAKMNCNTNVCVNKMQAKKNKF